MSTLVSIQNITKTYGSGEKAIHALKGVSLDIKRGEILSLLGSNGAGKTTLASIIVTLQPPTSGDILFNGKSIYQDPYTYRHAVGFCPQKPNVSDHLTLEQTLVFSGKFYGLTDELAHARAKNLMKKVGLTRYANRTINILSGGYKQRFIIARALMHKPQLILLDEPTVALDPHIRLQIWELIKELKADGVTIILTTHYLDEAEALADRVCIMDQGQIVLIDTPDNLKQQHEKGRLEDVFIKIIGTSDESAE